MPRTPLSAVEAAFVRLAQDHYGLTEAKARVTHALAPLFAAHGVPEGTAGVSIAQEGDALVLVTPDPAEGTHVGCSGLGVCGRRLCHREDRCMWGFTDQ
jgi:hypothetical protein